MMQIAEQQIKQWDAFEFSVKGPDAGNPFTEVQFDATFRYQNRAVPVAGFYDGGGTYKVRFMPDVPGEWHFETRSNVPELDGCNGSFVCVPPADEVHGPVQVYGKHHFAYADGTPYLPFGTTCYVWNHQSPELEQHTLETLQGTAFNKLRFCVFPKHYEYNRNEPPHYPFERNEQGWDFSRFNPAFFQHLEQCVVSLMHMGIEADIILLHAYDRWGFSQMSREEDERYLRYVVSRLSAYRNVWWSLANEYDLMKNKTMADWDRYCQIVQESDPSQHLRSIHHCHEMYDHNKPWITHASVQDHGLHLVNEWRQKFRKPIVVDECGYEGNIPQGWGNLSGRELLHRFWEGSLRGGYVGHGETFLDPEEVIWWSKGGPLRGESPQRIAFLRELMESGPEGRWEPVELFVVGEVAATKADDYYLCYFGVRQIGQLNLNLPLGKKYRVELVDPWEMTITPLYASCGGSTRMDLPSRPYLALRISPEC